MDESNNTYRVIEKKWWPDTFEIYASGKRKIEPRIADFDVKTGDVILAREWNPATRKYTGREARLKVKMVEKSTKNWPQKYYNKDEVDKYGFVFMVFE